MRTVQNKKVKIVSSQIIRHMRANALFSKLQDECAPLVDKSFEELFSGHINKMSSGEQLKFQLLGNQINKTQTDIIYLENQIATSYLYETIYETEYVDFQRFNLN